MMKAAPIALALSLVSSTAFAEPKPPAPAPPASAIGLAIAGGSFLLGGVGLIIFGAFEMRSETEDHVGELAIIAGSTFVVAGPGMFVAGDGLTPRDPEPQVSVGPGSVRVRF